MTQIPLSDDELFALLAYTHDSGDDNFFVSLFKQYIEQGGAGKKWKAGGSFQGMRLLRSKRHFATGYYFL